MDVIVNASKVTVFGMMIQWSILPVEIVSNRRGHAVAQEVSHWLPTTVALPDFCLTPSLGVSSLLPSAAKILL
jgi:hypothetical protein